MSRIKKKKNIYIYIYIYIMKKILVQNLDRLLPVGSGPWGALGAQQAQAWAQAGVQGAGCRRAWLACGRARRACWRWEWAQALARQAAEARRRWGGRRWGAQGKRACVGARTGAAGSWARGHGAQERGRAAAGDTSGCVGVQGRAGSAATRQPCAATRKPCVATRPGRPRHGHERAACALRLGQLGQVGVLCTLTQFLDPVRLDIFPESLNEHCSL